MHRAIRWTWRVGLLLLAGMLLAGVACAQRVEGDRAGAQGMYQAEVSVKGQGEAERNAGFARALAQVLGKLTGDRSAAARSGVGQELRNAKSYVDGYDYRQDQGVGHGGAPTFNTTLVVRFDKSQVDEIAGVLGLPMWPQPRPKPVLWLAIDDGRGPRLVGLAQGDAARPALDRAIERGYRLGLLFLVVVMLIDVWRLSPLTAAGASFDHVVRTTVFLADMNDFAAMNEVYAKYFTSDCPARRTSQVPFSFAREGFCVVVVLSGRSSSVRRSARISAPPIARGTAPYAQPVSAKRPAAFSASSSNVAMGAEPADGEQRDHGY